MPNKSNTTPTHKLCPMCKEWLPHDSFAKHKSLNHQAKYALRAYCKPCERSLHAPRALLVRNTMLKRRYGLTHEEYEAMLSRQNGCCAICKKPETIDNTRRGKPSRLAVDHCHATGKVRGILCSACNRGIAAFRDDAELLQRAIDYIKCQEIEEKLCVNENNTMTYSDVHYS